MRCVASVLHASPLAAPRGSDHPVEEMKCVDVCTIDVHEGHTMTTSKSPAVDREGKDSRINVRLAQSQATLIRRAAEADNKSLSEFVIGSAATAAEQVLADRRWFTVDDATWRAFEELLERPAVYKPRLAELLAEGDRFVD